MAAWRTDTDLAQHHNSGDCKNWHPFLTGGGARKADADLFLTGGGARKADADLWSRSRMASKEDATSRKISYDERCDEKRYVRCCLRWFERV